MQLPIEDGEKYGIIALDAASRVSRPLELGNGFAVVPHGACELPSHWKEWLGSLKVRDVEGAPLLVIAKVRSFAPSVLDADGDAMLRHVDALYWSLLASGRFRIERATRLTGGRTGEEFGVRQNSELEHLVSVAGIHGGPVREPDVIRAAKLATNLLALMRLPGMRRVQLAVRTFDLAASVEAFDPSYIAGQGNE